MKSATTKDLRQLLADGGTTVGGWMQLPDPSVAEIMGAAGYDWVAADLEHGRFNEQQLPDVFRALALGGTLPFARVGQVNPYAIKSALECGSQGLIFPMIESAAQLSQAISWAHYPPAGKRGVGYSRANLFGKDFQDYFRTFDPFLVAQIEHIDAVRCIEEIVNTPRLDAIMIGPYDLSASMGLTGQFDHPEFKAALSTVSGACRSLGMAAGQHIVAPDPERLSASVAAGYRFIAYGTDAIFLTAGCKRPCA